MHRTYMDLLRNIYIFYFHNANLVYMNDIITNKNKILASDAFDHNYIVTDPAHFIPKTNKYVLARCKNLFSSILNLERIRFHLSLCRRSLYIYHVKKRYQNSINKQKYIHKIRSE